MFKRCSITYSGFPTVSSDRVWLMPEGTDPQRLAEIETWLRPDRESSDSSSVPGVRSNGTAIFAAAEAGDLLDIGGNRCPKGRSSAEVFKSRATHLVRKTQCQWTTFQCKIGPQ